MARDMSEAETKAGIKRMEGQTSLPVEDVNVAPLQSRLTLAVACAIAAGYRWARIPCASNPKITAAFLDATEEVPRADKKCEACEGSGFASPEGVEPGPDGMVEMGYCEACQGHGHLSANGETENRRTVRWCFDPEVVPEVGGKSLYFAKFWERIWNPEWAAHYPNRVEAVFHRLIFSLANGVSPVVRLEKVEQFAKGFPRGPMRTLLEETRDVYKGLCYKLSAKAPHPVYQEPFRRHMVIRVKGKRAYLPIDTPKEERDKKLREWGMA